MTFFILFCVVFTGSPCLSFDVLRDDLGDSRMAYPHTAYIVAGKPEIMASQTKTDVDITCNTLNIFLILSDKTQS